jgi:hypothetical protein
MARVDVQPTIVPEKSADELQDLTEPEESIIEKLAPKYIAPLRPSSG